MRHHRFFKGFLVAFAAAVMAVAVGLRAQSAGGDQAAPLSSRTGVYTDAQATRGERTFANNCVGCHTTSTYTEATFRNNWNGATVWDLFSYMADSMPEDAPGSLTPAEYADVIAYFLKLNRTPTGEADLPSTADALRRITLEIGSAPAPTPARR